MVFASWLRHKTIVGDQSFLTFGHAFNFLCHTTFLLSVAAGVWLEVEKEDEPKGNLLLVYHFLHFQALPALLKRQDRKVMIELSLITFHLSCR